MSEAPTGSSEDRQAPRLGAIALLLGASVGLSRVVGYVREIVLANQLGAGSKTDAYMAAFTVPDVLNYLLAGGALTIAFVPFYSRVRQERGAAAAQSLFETVLGTTGVIVIAATAILVVFAEPLVAKFFYGFDAETQALTVRLSRILLPAQIFFVTGGILRAVLMVDGRFAAHALAPVLYNVGIIAGGLITGTPEGFAWGALVGAFAGPFLLPLLHLRGSHRLAVRFAPLAKDFRAYVWVALPLMLGFSLTTVDEWYEKLFGQAIGIGVVAWLGFARRLVQAPIAMIGQAIGVAALPTLTRLWSDRRGDEFEDVIRRALQVAIALGALSAAAVYVFADAIVELIYHHGAFSADAATRVASVLAVMSFAIVGWVAQQVAVRAFYAREEMWRAMALSTSMVVASIPLYLWLGDRDGAEGLAFAGVIAMSANALITLGWARLRFGGPHLLPLLDALARASAIAVLAAVAARGLADGVLASGIAPGGGKAAAALELAVGGGVFAVVGGLGIALLADDATRASVTRLLRRLPGVRGARP